MELPNTNYYLTSCAHKKDVDADVENVCNKFHKSKIHIRHAAQDPQDVGQFAFK